MTRAPLDRFCRDATLIMGVLNVTPDSFSDGGAYATADDAVHRGMEMVRQGAHLIDVGGESTRPGAAGVTEEEELRRVLPVVRGLSENHVAVSIDTCKANVARAALDAGARVINDVTAATGDPAMADVAARFACPLVLMHMQGTPGTMQARPHYRDVTGEVLEYLAVRRDRLLAAGVRRDNLIYDPGIGFGKTVAHNLRLLRDIGRFRELGPVLVGTSRKSFIGAVLDLPVADRIEGTAATVAYLAARQIDAVRVHDVLEMSRVCRMIGAILDGGT